MEGERWRQVDKIFHDLVEQTPEQRASFLKRVCGGDPALKKEVEDLVRAYERSGSFLDSPALVPAPASWIGHTLGSYEVKELLGSGGMGEVYIAEDSRLGRQVALKVLAPLLLYDSHSRTRFLREARLVASLNHPHICTLYDIGEQNGVDFLVMEYLKGETLAALLQRGPLPLDEALHNAIEIVDAMDRAHRQGIIHRDLKPGNIMMTESGTKLLDFGLAKPVTLKGTTGDPTDLSSKGMIFGTLQYMAPEQVEGKNADARTDIFAFGSVLYETITGHKAFRGDNQARLMAAILEHEPLPIPLPGQMTMPSLERLRDTCEDRWNRARDLWRELKWVAESLERLVKVCLAKDPKDRWQTAGDLRRQLKSIADSVAVGGPTFIAIR